MADGAEIVIIGGGITGASIAYFLARQGAGKDVLLLERDTLASGSTAYAVGGIRSQYSTPINIEMSIESVRFWRAAEDHLGVSVGYRENGYLFLAQTEAQREAFARNVALQNSFHVPTQLISPDDAARIVPGLNTADLTAAAWNPEDALAVPVDATNAYARRAREGGVRIRQGVEVTGIEVTGGRVSAVQTAGGRIEARTVVNAAGPWAGLVGAMVGLDIPVKPYRREIYVSEAFPRDVIADVPTVIDLAVGWYFRREGEGILMSGMKDSHSSFAQHVNRADFPQVAAVASHRMPALANAEFGKKAWAGLYDVSPDDHAIMGGADEVGGYYSACGYSGHGFQHSPATGRLMAELLLTGTTTGIDIRPLGLERFRTGALFHEPLTAHAGAYGGQTKND